MTRKNRRYNKEGKAVNREACRQCDTKNWRSLSNGLCQDCESKRLYIEAAKMGLVLTKLSPRVWAVFQIEKYGMFGPSKLTIDGANAYYLSADQVFRGSRAEAFSTLRELMAEELSRKASVAAPQ